MLTLRDIATEAGVSVSTVSRVINSSYSVSEDKRKLVLQAMEKLGYEPPSYKSKSSSNGLIVVIDTLPYTEQIDGMTIAACALGYKLLKIYLNADSCNLSYVKSLFKQLDLEKRISGIILINFICDDKDLLSYLDNFPVVQVNQPVNLKSHFFVASDFLHGSYDLAKHIISTGKKRIAAVVTENEFNDIYFLSQRYQGYLLALLEAGITPDPKLELRVSDTVEGHSHITELIQGLIDSGCELPDAYFCFNDLYAGACMSVLARNGISIPGEVAVAGTGNSPGCMFYTVPLTTVDFAAASVGEEAVYMLHSVINKMVSGGKKTLIPHNVIIRESTAGK